MPVVDAPKDTTVRIEVEVLCTGYIGNRLVRVAEDCPDDKLPRMVVPITAFPNTWMRPVDPADQVLIDERCKQVAAEKEARAKEPKRFKLRRRRPERGQPKIYPPGMKPSAPPSPFATKAQVDTAKLNRTL